MVLSSLGGLRGALTNAGVAPSEDHSKNVEQLWLVSMVPSV